jgi:methylthioribose-1-phosphate isomerase
LKSFFTLQWIDDKVRMLDQRRLPHEKAYIDCETPEDVAEAIRSMVIRGAPAIGAAAAFGMALAAMRSEADEPEGIRAHMVKAAETLKASRPTAANLSWAAGRVLAKCADLSLNTADSVRRAAAEEAQRIADEDVEINRRIGLNGLPLIPDGAKIIHHCNTGALATVDVGTALGVIVAAHERGKRVHVYVDETRPRLQGARLTAWELKELGVPFTLIVDGASGYLMQTVGIDLCIVGCDRTAANGDFANKIGTYNLAVVARAHGVPFYVACPSSSIDFGCPSGDRIPIEMRDAEEVVRIGDTKIAPDGSPVLNPAFDVTPAKYVTAFITEHGLVKPPFRKNLLLLFKTVHA